MSQILHIFRKDTRRFWPEILLNLAMTLTLVWVGPYQWIENPAESGHQQLQLLRQLSFLIEPLMVLAWVLLISRAVHAEPLVGDRQFWITRPYEWRKLLGAKMLFLATYLYLPFLAMQLVLLWRAGFSPEHAIPGLIFNLVLVSGALILPILAIAAVTPTFSRMVLVFVGGLLCVWVAVAVFQILLSQLGGDVRVPFGDFYMYAMVFAACAAVIAMMYGVRNTRTAVLLLAGAALCAGLALFLEPGRMLIGPIYAHSTGASAEPVQISFDSAIASHSTSRESWGNGSWQGTQLPVLVSGVADGHTLLFDDVKVTIDGPDGAHWSSQWQGLGYGAGQHDPAGPGHAGIRLAMPKSVYDKFAGMPLQVHLTLALTEARIARVTQISNPYGGFAVPGFGYCEPRNWTPQSIRSSNAFFGCRFTPGTPLTEIASQWIYRPCGAKAPAAADEEKKSSYGWVGTEGVLQRGMALVPIATQNFGFAGVSNENAVVMCPQQPGVATFTQYEPVRRILVTLNAQDFHLTQYKKAPPWARL